MIHVIIIMISNFLEEELDDEMRELVEKSARHLYGLIHARFIITGRGLSKMVTHSLLSSSFSLYPSFWFIHFNVLL